MRLFCGGLIDRTRPLAFTFDGRRYEGFAGDTLASALLANGVTLLGRSFKYHRPRGVLAAGVEEPNALVELRTGDRREPNVRATTVELYDGLVAHSQNRFPSLRFDAMAVTSLAAPFFAAGFYYKTFMWPASFWERVYEPLIRRAAGLGRAAGKPDPDRYVKATAHCDVLVIGGGEAGLQAALEAGRTGQRVLLCEQDSEPGGFALAQGRKLDVDAAMAALADLPDVRIMPRTAVFGGYDGGVYGAVEQVAETLPEPGALPRQRLWRIVAKSAVLASGATERTIVFGGNDLPGVMLAGALQTYLVRYAVCPGRRAILYANHDGVAELLDALPSSGMTLVAYVDARPDVPDAVRTKVKALGGLVFAGASIRRAYGRGLVQGAEIVAAHGGTMRLACDILAMSGGWSPNVQLATHLGARPYWDDALVAFVAPKTLPLGMSVVGAAAGDGINKNIVPLFRSPSCAGKAFVDFQNDVTVDDIALAHREGFSAVEHLKRYTTLGMATDQGKTSNVPGLAVMADLTGQSIEQTGTTRARPPVSPVAFGALAGAHRGQHFKPTRLTPTHGWAGARGAVFTDAGMWKRAAYFPRGTKSWLEATIREVQAVRGGVGICDVTTLGKIDIQGPDAAKLLDLAYTNTFSTLPIGRARYGLMLREDGFLMDDGTTTRLGQAHYLMTTTTANAAKVLQHLEFIRQWLFPSLDVQLASATDQWAQLAVAGPKSRDVLRQIVDPEHDVSNAALPYMGAKSLTVCGGLNARLFRLSFSGELAYELAVPAAYGAALAETLMQAGQDQKIVPYGLEALAVMRIEKGHPAGAELNGQTTAHDLGLAKMLSTKKDFIGRAMAARPALTEPARPTLVGLRPVNPADRMRGGAHLLRVGAAAVAANDEGHVTSAAYSPSLGQWIGLGLLKHGPSRHGEVVRVYDPVRGGDFAATVCPPVFVDPEGERLRA